MNDRVYEIRVQIGMSQETFGQKLGVTRAAISRIESGKSSLTESNIKLICSLFNVSEDWLRTGAGEMFVELSQQDAMFIELGEFVKINDPIKNELALMVMGCLRTMSEKEFEPIAKHIKKLALLIAEKEKTK